MNIFSSVLTKIVALFTITVFVSRFKRLDLVLSLSIFVQADERKSPDSVLSTDAIVFLFFIVFAAFLHTNTDGNAMVFRSLLRFAKDNLRLSHLKCLEQTRMSGNLKILALISSYGHYPFVKHFVLLET